MFYLFRRRGTRRVLLLRVAKPHQRVTGTGKKGAVGAEQGRSSPRLWVSLRHLGPGLPGTAIMATSAWASSPWLAQ